MNSSSAENCIDSPSPLLQLKGVSRKWHEKYALKRVNLAIQPGEIVALIGPSGSGKSTLLRILAGVLRTSEGHYLVDHQDLGNVSTSSIVRHRTQCRIVEQSHLLVPQITVHQNVIAGKLSHFNSLQIIAAALWPVDKKGVYELLKDLGIAEQQWKRAADLSVGQMQRVAIARALISNPSLLLADEPTASLDPSTAKQVTELLLTQARRRHISLVFCTHRPENVISGCDRVIGLSLGSVVLNGKPADISDEELHQLYTGQPL